MPDVAENHNKNWRDRAACLGLAPELFFSSGLHPEAIRTCQSCPVIGPCKEDALSVCATEQVGIRAGLYAVQRVAILRGRALFDRQPMSYAG
jgi:transcription factor WhiB